MANYRVHDGLTLLSACALGPVCYGALVQYRPVLWGYSYAAAPLRTTLLVVVAYLVSGLLLSNDLDTPSRIYQRWGPLRVLWFPYQRLVAHRSVLSHGVGVGPLLRLLYLYGVMELLLLVGYRLAALLGYSTQMLDTGFRVSAQVWPFLLAQHHLSVPVLVGLVLGGLLHSLIDLF